MTSDPATNGPHAFKLNSLPGNTGPEPLSGDSESNDLMTRGSRGRDPRHKAYYQLEAGSRLEPEHSSHHEPESGHKAHHQPEPGLNVRLLKERLELEVGLIREGLRLLAFICLCICFAIAFFQSTQPTHRAESRFYVASHLKIGVLEDAVSPTEVFDAIMTVSSHVREMVPSSSHYITDPLSQVLIRSVQLFPSGPIQLPATRNPQLLLEWTMTVRHGLEKSTGLMQKKRLIARSYPSGDTSGSSCWAWYSLDYNHFRCEYGRNNLDDMYPSADFLFDSTNITDRYLFSMVALKVNTTHATMRLQDAGEMSTPLAPGTLPAGCANGVLEVGDVGLILANLQYYPMYLSELELQEIEQSGQTLEEMAAGVALLEPGTISAESMVEAHAKTQKLVEGLGHANLDVSKLSASLASSGGSGSTALGATTSKGDDEDPLDFAADADATVGSAAARNVTTGGELSWDLDSDEFWQVFGYPEDDSPVDRTSMIQAQFEMSYAMRALAVANRWSFSISWWAKADGRKTETELRFSSFQGKPGDKKIRFEMQMYIEDLGGGSTLQGWLMMFNHAPYCTSDTDEPCIRSPGIFCQAPDISGYDGIWRHYALRYSHGSEDGTSLSEAEIFVDGRSLCGIEFPADAQLIPHNLPGNKTSFGIMPVHTDSTPGSGLQLGDIRVYPWALNSTEVKLLSQDQKMKECLDLELANDNSEWMSEFGQTCTDLSSLSSPKSTSYSPAACRSEDAKLNCPVSCMHELSPICNDGTPPLPKQSESFTAGSSRVVLASLYSPLGTNPQMWMDGDETLSLETLVALSQASTWKNAQNNGKWYKAFNDIRKSEYGAFVPSIGAITKRLMSDPTRNTGLWVSNFSAAVPQPSSDWCPGAEIDYELFLETPPLIQDMCMAETQGWAVLVEVAQARSEADTMQVSGWQSGEFSGDFPQKGESHTIYFWAKMDNPTEAHVPAVTGIDNDNNICFAIRSTTAWMQMHGMVAEYLEDLVTDSNGGDNDSPKSNGDFDQLLEQSNGTIAETNGNLEDTGGGIFQKSNGTISGNKTGQRKDSLADKRMSVSVPDAAKNSFRSDEWIFFALSVDMEEGIVRFAVNGYVTEARIPEGDWGCNSLESLLNTGGDMDWSPVRVARFSLTKGSLQRLYLGSRESFVTHLTGEDRSRLERMKLTDVEIKPFSKKMVALAPPVLLQRRVADSKTQASVCKGNVVQRYNERLQMVLGKKCTYPLNCPDLSNQYVRCVPDEGEPPETFFGEPRIEGSSAIDGVAFADFAWTLQSEVIVRDGEELRPADDYIDSNTMEVKMIMPFFSPTTQIATVIIASVDFSNVKTEVSIRFLQLTVLVEDDYLSLLGWTCAAIVFSVISIVLAFPAAVQELKELSGSNLKMLHHSLGTEGNYKRIYSSNTTQPDIFDVVLNLAMIGLMAAYLTVQTINKDEASAVFGDIAFIDWSSNLPFVDKIGVFLDALDRALTMVATEEQILTVAFWMLVLCLVRLVIFMRMHPKIASITETFASVGGELINFAFSFGVIFVFLAYLAHIRFGYLYDEFSTFRQSLITQFALLIGDSSPDYSSDPLMCVYVVGFVFTCTLSLLNFLLAIVVNGYTLVTERALENKVARAVLVDVFTIPPDIYMWIRHRLPSRLEILRQLQDTYPDVFADDQEVVVALSLEGFSEVVRRCSDKSRKDAQSARLLFDHYMKHTVLQLRPNSADRPSCS